ncbi:MAG: histidinol dehydrogenase [Thermonemataceae bacterium]|nr:histidinol dehydrogenase [Thermonemataceae bacterium]
MRITKNPPKKDWAELLKRPSQQTKDILEQVKPILEDICENGDKAIKKYNKKFDNYTGDILVSAQEMKEAIKKLDKNLKKAIEQAYKNIYAFHQSQKGDKVQKINTMEGVTCWRKSLPIEKVGLYIPGGTAPLFSTVLMLGIPAKIADCKEIILCSPPRNEELSPAILFAAHLVGINKIYKVGGVQAIGAMAYGTDSIAKVDKIFGPGNQYVTAAKQYVSQSCVAIDMPAGPSEVLVWADDTADADFVAADLLSQAEHGADSQVILVSSSEKLVKQVQQALDAQILQLPRAEIAKKSLKNSLIILFDNEDNCLEISNFYAPEHLILAVKKAEIFAEKITNAGSVFIGNYSPESAGDYASGTNHTLPTNGYARAYSGVSVDSFIKKVTFQKITKKGLLNIGETIELMAAAEELEAHKNAVSIRLKKLRK